MITDVVNDLGVKILQQYSMHGNVAFSPTGVAFVLVALYEGSAGRGNQQIVEAMGLPSRDVTRIGFRDIHRRLRVRSEIIITRFFGRVSSIFLARFIACSYIFVSNDF